MSETVYRILTRVEKRAEGYTAVARALAEEMDHRGLAWTEGLRP
jgi:hypothetical protein